MTFPTPEQLEELQRKEYELDIKELTDTVTKTLIKHNKYSIPAMDISKYSAVVIRTVVDELEAAGWDTKVVTNASKNESVLSMVPVRVK